MEIDRVFTADCIKKRRLRHGKVEFLIKWKGFASRKNTWEPESNILDPRLILDFEERLAEEYRKGRPGRKPANLKDLKNKRRELLAKCKEFQLLSQQAKLLQQQQAKRSETGSEEDEEEEEYESGKDPEADLGLPDANGNFARSADEAAATRAKPVHQKPAFLQLGGPHSSPAGGNCRDARSPLAGCLPSPTVPRPPNSAAYVACDAPLASPNSTPDSKPPSPATITAAVTPTATSTTVKLGKFALLRKYRNSLEESTQVSVTNVTIGDVTIAITESNTPKGFFRKYEPESVCW